MGVHLLCLHPKNYLYTEKFRMQRSSDLATFLVDNYGLD